MTSATLKGITTRASRLRQFVVRRWFLSWLILAGIWTLLVGAGAIQQWPFEWGVCPNTFVDCASDNGVAAALRRQFLINVMLPPLLLLTVIFLIAWSYDRVRGRGGGR